MSTMEELIKDQNRIAGDIRNLSTNFRKDGAHRKTADYLKRRLETLEWCWENYQENHVELEKSEDKTSSYFTSKHYESTRDLYESTKRLITDYQVEYVPPPKEKSEQSTDSKTSELLRKQGSNFKAFLRTVNSIDLDLVSERWELEDLLNTLQARWSTIDSLHWEIDSESVSTDEAYEQAFSSNERRYNELKKEINSKLWSMSHRDKSTPKMEIPQFSGNYQQWVSFKDLFTEAIHRNPSLSNAQKMQFLKGKIRGEAERLIQHLQISSDNYNVCWEILNHRYNNKKLIFSSHMNILFGLPNIQQQSLGHIKKMHDVTLECLNAIKNLGVDISTWDPILVHLLSQKLDSDSYAEYLESLKNSRELPVLQEFIDFLESKFTILESSRRKQDNAAPKSSNYQGNSSNFKIPKFPYNNNQQGGNKPYIKALHVSGVQCPICSQEHGIYNCKTFLNMQNDLKLKTISRLQLCVNCLVQHQHKQCFSRKRCRTCGGNHNSVIHDACTQSTPSTSYPRPSGISNSKANYHSKQNDNVDSKSHVSQSQNHTSEVLLSTAQIKIMSADGTYQTMRALIDQGSQISLITENAAQRLGIKRQRCKGVIFGVGEKESNCKGMLNITCTSMYNDFTFNAEVLIMKNVTKNLPNQSFAKPSWSFIENINLADPEFFSSKPVDLLLGADIYSIIMLGGIVRGEQLSQPIAQQTQLGWLLCGNVKTFQCNVILNNTEDLQRFWELEEISEETDLSLADQECIEFYQATTKRREDGRYEVMLPLIKEVEENLGSSKHLAMAQFRNLERKFEKQEKLAKDYKKFINEYIELKHMIPAVSNKTPLECYLPHHSVQRADSTTTKLRVVFNASAKTTSGLSLNDLMDKGPNLQQDLQSLLLKWRQYQYAFTADIEKMYRQIWTNEDYQQFQKIVWRESPEQPLQSFQLTTVTYGTKAAPFLAMMTLKRLAADERVNYPEASKVLEEAFYMDDLVHGTHSIQQGKQLISDLDLLLKSGGFTLRKWSSNKQELLEDITDFQSKQEQIFNFKSENTSKTLGLCWSPAEDSFTFRCNMSPLTTKITKRSLLSEISKLYDPLGWLAPVTTKLKILFQKVWSTTQQWDDTVSDGVYNEWSKIRADIDNIHLCKIPRWIGCHENSVIELHGFSDASLQAFSGVVFARILNKDTQQSSVVLVASKTKLVPRKKSVSLPRLELNGAQLLSKLMHKIVLCLKQSGIEIYGWSDSMVVLSWLQGEPGRWKPFVANRVKSITEIMPKECWRYVKSSENPADAASRGLYPSQLKDESLWWQGPIWLPSFESQQEQRKIYTTDQELKLKQANIIQKDNSKSIIDELLEKHSSFTTITRVLAWVFRALAPKHKREQRSSYLTLPELNQAKNVIIKHVQKSEFETEIEHLNKQGKLESKSKLLNLNPFIDQEGILRVGGRLKNANLDPDMKHPKIIPHDSRLTSLLIDQAHHLTFHGGARVTLAKLRKQYWILGGNRATKKHIRRCVTCRKHDTKKNSQLMGDLPTARSNPACPFYHTGVDYTGFVEVKANKGRGIKTTKGYIAVFVCMVTKAVHLELVSEMTSSAFLAALRRMAARRGAPRHLYSDCGTNFTKASRVLQEELNEIQQAFKDDFFKEVAEMNIEWHFNAPSWPSAGGLWERAVRSLKFHLKRTVGEQKLTFEEYSTILAQIEASLNSRPLCALSEDVDDLDFLTPAHFLTGRSGLTVIETVEDARTRWQLTRKIFQDYWKRWKEEYLTQQTARSKWLRPQENIKVGDLVIIHEDNIPAGKWLMGRVVELHPGHDGYVRVVSLKTKNGYLKRPVVKLSVLPIEANKQENNKCEQDSTSDNSKQQSAGKSRTSKCSFIAMTLLLFMSIIAQVHSTYSLTALNSNLSIYFDPISKMQLVRDKWTLVVYYNMSPYWEGITAYNKLANHLEQTCSDSNINIYCNMILPQLRHDYTELQYYNHLLLTQHFSGRSLQLRGLINAIATTLLQNLKRFQDTLVDTVTDIYHGQLNMHLLTPEQLREELSIFSAQLSEEITLPVENIQEDFRRIYKLLKVKAIMTDKYLLFEVLFPLISRDSYKLYQMIPIPQQVDENMVNIVPVSDYIAINLRRDAYILMSMYDLYQCSNQENALMCQLQKSIYHLTEDKHFCQIDHNTNQCKIVKNICRSEYITFASSCGGSDDSVAELSSRRTSRCKLSVVVL